MMSREHDLSLKLIKDLMSEGNCSDALAVLDRSEDHSELHNLYRSQILVHLGQTEVAQGIFDSIDLDTLTAQHGMDM